MKHWTVCDMIEERIFGFVRTKDNKRFEPFEEVITISRNIAEDNGFVILKSANREARFRDDFVQPLQRLFRGATLYLGARPKKNDTGLGHLLFFDLGREYYAVLTPVISDEERKKFTKEAES